MENGKNRNVQVASKKAATLKEYEMYIDEKSNIFARIINKIKNSKKQLLLMPGKDERNNKSNYDLMYRVTGFKENIFDRFDPLAKKHYIKNNTDGIIMEVVGKNKMNPVTNNFKSIIIPQNIKSIKEEN